jgi:hypothetical protein
MEGLRGEQPRLVAIRRGAVLTEVEARWLTAQGRTTYFLG